MRPGDIAVIKTDDYEKTHSAFDKLYEQKNEENDLTVNNLLCYREDPINKASDFTKNKCYPIEYINYDENYLGIINDAGIKTTWSIYNRDGYNYEDWFYVMPKDIQNMDFFDKLYEQEDDFGWAKELTKFPEVVVTRSGFYYPTNTEVMLNVKIPGMEEFNQKYGKHWWDSEDYHNFNKSFGGEGDVGMFFLHQQVPSLGAPENGDICYLINNTDTNEYNERISHLVRKSDGKHFIINDDGYRPARRRISKIREQEEDELEWARDLVSGVENYWDVFKQSSPKNLNKLKFKLIPKSNGSEYFKESLDSCSFNGNVEWWFKQVFKINKIKQMVRSSSDCEAGFNFGMDLDEDVLSAQLVKCLTDETDYDLSYWINEDMVDIIVIE